MRPARDDARNVPQVTPGLDDVHQAAGEWRGDDRVGKCTVIAQLATVATDARWISKG